MIDFAVIDIPAQSTPFQNKIALHQKVAKGQTGRFWKSFRKDVDLRKIFCCRARKISLNKRFCRQKSKINDGRIKNSAAEAESDVVHVRAEPTRNTAACARCIGTAKPMTCRFMLR